MRKRSAPQFICALFLVAAFLFFPATARTAGETFPKPAGAVNDFAGVIPAQYNGPMENLAREVLEKTGTAIVVATVETIGDNDPSDYANRLYQAWGIGKKGEDKGVLIFLAVKERRVRIETGYGVEGILPDGLVGEILDRYADPHFKEGDYGKGLAETMAAVSSVVAKAAGVTLTGAPPPEQRPVGTERRLGIGQMVLLILAAGLSPRHPPGQGDAPLDSPAADERRGRQARRGRIRRLRRGRIRRLRRGIERRRRGGPRILKRGEQMAKIPKKPEEIFAEITDDYRQIFGDGSDFHHPVRERRRGGLRPRKVGPQFPDHAHRPGNREARSRTGDGRPVAETQRGDPPLHDPRRTSRDRRTPTPSNF